MNQELLTNLVLVMISTFGPTLAAYIGYHMRQADQRARKEHWYAMAHEFAATAVLAAEQLGLSDQLKDYASSKFDYALAHVKMMLQANGIKLDLNIPAEHLKAIIEAEVNQLPMQLPAIYTGEVLQTE